MTATEALEKIRNHILNGDHSDGILAPILNWCDEVLADYDESVDECAKYRAALKQIIQYDRDMNDAINRSGYATGGEAGHYFHKAVKVAKEALE